ncbi:hypothetical protein MKQ70_21350 [Chitinophaga sedimenti]|uniref:hypothetical protein n=1 Tax=Chitinophaga sedimenti TaxID=2033606 RepID=UPI002002DB3D|nr:hypothetical protein [Chitinophaga sedimenti]MCK7557410.1 hypothetical protein [Chitinophaga sedimenti]
MKNKYYPGLLAAIILVLSSLPGFAQDTSKGRWSASAKADKLSEKIDKELHLSKEQDKQIHAINQDISLRRDAIKRDTTISKKQNWLRSTPRIQNAVNALRQYSPPPSIKSGMIGK